MIAEKENDIQTMSFWNSRKGIMLQIVIVLLPPIFFLKSGSLLLAGLSASVLLSWLGLRLRQLTWPDIGLKRPSNFRNVFLTVILATLAVILLSYTMRHVVTYLTDQEPEIEAFKNIEGNPKALLVGLFIVWTFGAFAEEMFFRGFLINAFYKLLPGHQFNDRLRWGLSLLITSVLVGFGHTYQGITGMILTGLIGFCFGLIYLFSHRNLWPGILTHGLYDTVAFILVYFGINLDQLIK
jgi:membrane protease YdiL (CAAX protease family)